MVYRSDTRVLDGYAADMWIVGSGLQVHDEEVVVVSIVISHVENTRVSV